MRVVAVVAMLCLPALALPSGRSPDGHPLQEAGTAVRQTERDEYTSYELLAPDTHQFRILYDVTATTPGARFYFNAIRKGSEASDERVIDAATGASAPFEIVSGADARASGHPEADLDTRYIKVTLARPVPAGGGVRLRIAKTYKDAGSYARDGQGIVFKRSLGIRRNKVVLPPGYELVACNVPSQVLEDAGGRIAISFMNANPGAADLALRARPLPPRPSAVPRARVAAGEASPGPTPGPSRSLAESAAWPIPERASQDRDIVYFLQPPETHAFDLYHDYTESREGTDTYLNVVRAGSRVSNPSARSLDSGESLPTEILRGREALARANIDPGEPIGDDTEVVVIRFPPVVKGRSVRLRISETYTDPNRYGLVGDTLVWHRAFGRPRNAVVLPEGYYLVASSIPGTVSLADDGRVRLDFWNGRPDEIEVLVRARRRWPR